jgi:hypothetical protein
MSDSPGAAQGLDTIGWFIATLHSQLGHDKAAAVIGQPPGDKTACLICRYEQYPGPADPRHDTLGLPVDTAAEKELRRQAVIRALAPRNAPETEKEP